MPSNRTSRIKPSDVAADTKKRLIPEVNKHHRNIWPPHSYLFAQPLADLALSQGPYLSSEYPAFYVTVGDPADCTIEWTAAEIRNGAGTPHIPLICAANEKRPGGDWETGVAGYEERLCRRSNLSATLSSPAPNSYGGPNYPIPLEGAIFSPHVVIFREFQDRIESLPSSQWTALPVVSMPPTRWPKLTHGGTKYSFSQELELVRNKMRALLRICVYNGAHQVVIGDFGLGNSYRNPPQEMAELWRQVFLFDPELRGQFSSVMFAFEDPRQSTAKFIQDDIVKKSKSDGGSKGKSKSASSSSSSSSSSHSNCPTDFDIFAHIFSPEEVYRVRSRPDPRYGLGMITSPS